MKGFEVSLSETMHKTPPPEQSSNQWNREVKPNNVSFDEGLWVQSARREIATNFDKRHANPRVTNISNHFLKFYNVNLQNVRLINIFCGHDKSRFDFCYSWQKFTKCICINDFLRSSFATFLSSRSSESLALGYGPFISYCPGLVSPKAVSVCATTGFSSWCLTILEATLCFSFSLVRQGRNVVIPFHQRFYSHLF